MCFSEETFSNVHLTKKLQVEERGAEFFSNLVFKDVSSRHSGQYTCVASNSAAKVNYTAELIVKGTLAPIVVHPVITDRLNKLPHSYAP